MNTICRQLPVQYGKSNRGRLAGFTLLEVIAAVIISLGMLGVVLYFYQQTATLRDQIVLESSRLTAVRLLMDRITTELRTAVPGSEWHQGLAGTSNEISFVRTDLPVWPVGPADEKILVKVAPLKIITYRLGAGGEEMLSPGVEREEKLWNELPPLTDVDSEPALYETNQISLADTNMAGSTNQAGGQPLAMNGALLVARDFQYLNFRYFDGVNWLDSWTALELPLGVEVTFGVDPPAEEELPDEEPKEVFRRIIALPGARPATQTATAEATGEEIP